MMQQAGMILMEEHDDERDAHISQKRNQSHWQSRQGQNNLIKAHTPYLKNHWMKDMVNVSK
jgi:hypothetical protein